MCDHKLARIQHEVGDQAIDETDVRQLERVPLLRGQALDLGDAVAKPVRYLDVLSLEAAHQLDVVVAGDAQPIACLDHSHNKLNGLDYAGTSVDQIAEEDGLAAVAMRPQRTRVWLRVPERAEQLFQLVD